MSQFCTILQSLANREARVAPGAVAGRAPDAVHMAYVDLVAHAFVFIRANVGIGAAATEEIHDLADALHNIGGILKNYGSWIDDERYRRMHTRRFDARWAKDRYGIEQFLEDRIAYYSKMPTETPNHVTER